MQWFGKAIGAALGLAVAGPFGSVLGALLGHQFDQGIAALLTGGAGKTQGLFFEVSFEVMGHLAKVDGRVSEEEVRIARRIMHAMRLGPEQVRAAIACFTRGKDRQYALQERLQALYRRIGQRRDLARAFIEIQVQAAVGGGEIDNGKRQLLWEVARHFGFTRVELAQIESLIRAQQTAGSATEQSGLSIEDAYKALGLTAQASDREVKTAYRRLMNQHHPDKLVSKGLPESMMAIAQQKTREIRAAYDRIKSARNFK
jgi:DnaJ like chaperone protein